MSVIDISRLPPPHIVEELSFEAIYAQRKAKLLELYPDVESALQLESEPISYLLQENAYREIVWRQRVNETAKAVMVAFSTDTDLDQLCANVGVSRLTITPANPDTIPPTPAVMEEDDALRLRFPESFETRTVAGPSRMYEALARTADGRVADARATSPAGAEVVLTVLSRDGAGTAPADLLTVVDTALSAEDVRPVADRLTVRSADIVEYSIAAVIHTTYGPEAPLLVAAATQQLATWLQSRKLGNSVRLTKLASLLHVEGVGFVTITAPAEDIVLQPTQYAHCTAVSVTAEIDND